MLGYRDYARVNANVTADLVIGLDDAFGIEILADLAHHIVRAHIFDIAHHDGLGVAFRLGGVKAEFFRGPQAEELVAARGGLESQLLVMRELLLEAFLALVERGHALRPDVLSGTARRVAALHIEGSPSRQPQDGMNLVVAAVLARVYADCTPRDLELAFVSPEGPQR